MEQPLIKDILNKGHNSIHLHSKDTVCGPKCLFLYTYNTFVTSKSGQPLLKGQKPSHNVSFIRRFPVMCNVLFLSLCLLLCCSLSDAAVRVGFIMAGYTFSESATNAMVTLRASNPVASPFTVRVQGG